MRAARASHGMTDPTGAIAVKAQPDNGYFSVWMAGLCVLFIFAGFTPTYFWPMMTGTLQGIAPVVHIHALVFFGWAVLFLVQTLLIARRRTGMHRSLGLLGISVATAVVILGFVVSLRANASRLAAGDAARAYGLGFSNTVALTAFASMVAAAIHKRKSRESHERLMLFATVNLLAAPVVRLYRPVFSPAPPPPWLVFATIDIILVACIVHDWRTTRRIHPATAVAGSLLLASQVLRFPVGGMAWWRSTYDVLLQLVA
ncbi:MAG TPA: hypothetical protein VMM79_03205 [Longimicrobiales bacterium]|nr:hypothetical protein [Longimicrobiales bacterium]